MYELRFIGYWDRRDQYAVMLGDQQICVMSCASDDEEWEGDFAAEFANMLSIGRLIVDGLNRLDP